MNPSTRNLAIILIQTFKLDHVFVRDILFELSVYEFGNVVWLHCRHETYTSLLRYENTSHEFNS